MGDDDSGGLPLAIEEDWDYELLSAKNPSSSDQPAVVIRNTTLMEIQPEQTHIIAMMKQGRRTTCVLNKKQASAEFKGSTAVAINR